MNLNLKEEYSPLEQQLIRAIDDSYKNHLISNAIFLAERLIAEKTNQETKIILAKCYLAEGKPFKVTHILKHCTNPQARYLCAFAWIKQKKYDEAERVLRFVGKGLRYSKISSQSTQGNVNGAYSFYLMGLISESKDNVDQAKEYYKKAFELNSSLWIAYERLCFLGCKLSKILIKPTAHSGEMEEEDKGSDKNLKKNIYFSYSQDNKFSKNSKNKSRGHLNEKSDKLKAGSKRKSQLQEQQSKYKSLGDLIRAFMKPFHDISKFNIQDAIKGFKSLSLKQRRTGWVLSKLGECYFYIGNYVKAVAKYKEAFSFKPYQLMGVEFYSSSLYTLNKTKELFDLAFRVIDKDPFSPQAWVALGNCCSKDNDSESALKYFHRAIKLDKNFSYAHYLRGHEFVSCDRFSDAIACYLKAINVNKSSFFAFWGLGNVYLKQEKYEKALNNFMTADKINSLHPIIKSSIGKTYLQKDHRESALKWLNHAERLDSDSLGTRYFKAKVFCRSSEYERALKVLKDVMEKSPKEFEVHLLIGHIYQKMNNKIKALEFYHTALDLDMKQNLKVKGLIDSLTKEHRFHDDLEAL